MIMAAKRKLDSHDFEKLMKSIVIVSFRYSVICSLNPNELETVYNNHNR